ncbi:hypothetical protein BT93_H2650 [Corymbia citriodora subsp. variegata]|nr:hypothetical protein BT93_H2650 [Corymbia citriodora subsp. variegata]
MHYLALDTLGSTKWRVNRRVLAVVESLWAQGRTVGVWSRDMM